MYKRRSSKSKAELELPEDDKSTGMYRKGSAGTSASSASSTLGKLAERRKLSPNVSTVHLPRSRVFSAAEFESIVKKETEKEVPPHDSLEAFDAAALR